MSKEFKPFIDITEVQGQTFPRFRIGRQGFLIGTCGSNEEAKYFCEMLEKAFANHEKYALEKAGYDEVIDVLIESKKAIESLPRETLGSGGVDEYTRYPLRDELLHNIDKALIKAGCKKEETA